MGAQSEADLAGEMAGAHGRIWMTGGAPRANWVCTQPRTRLGLATYGRTPGGGGHAARGGGLGDAGPSDRDWTDAVPCQRSPGHRHHRAACRVPTP